MLFRPAQVLVTEASSALVSRAIAHFTKSRATHAFVVVDDAHAIEARFPRVRVLDLHTRVAELRETNRAFAVLDFPDITDTQRALVTLQATAYVGRRYDVAQIGLFALTGQFWQDGPLRLVCSRLITSSFSDGAALDLFPHRVVTAKYPTRFPRTENLRAGYAIPAELLRSALRVTEFSPSSRVQTVDDFLRL